MSDYQKQRLDHINAGRPKKQKKAGGNFFMRVRPYMTGTCACGCGKPSEKYDDFAFTCSICHIFPQRLFGSIRDHNSNWVERAWIGGCHNNMDERTVWEWPKFADWEKIVAAFYELTPLLTDAERATKFYTNLQKVVQANP